MLNGHSRFSVCEGSGETECLVDIGLRFSGHAFTHASACVCAHTHTHTHIHTLMTPNLPVRCAKVHGQCDFPSIFQETTSYCERRARSHLLHQPFARTNAFFYSFVPSGTTAWNHLTEQQVTASSLQAFKRLLH